MIYLLKFSNFKCRGPNKAPFAPAFCFRPVYRALERLQLPGFREQITVPLRCENYSPPHPEIRAPAPGVVFLGGTCGWGFMFMKTTIGRSRGIVLPGSLAGGAFTRTFISALEVTPVAPVLQMTKGAALDLAR